jgi:CRP/FNR family transcriptional regulator, anaerobic regulatory protein
VIDRRRTALEPTAQVLLTLFLRAEQVGLTKGNMIQFPFTQQHLADTLGMSLVHTNKTLKRLYSSGALRLELVDRSALAQTAGLDISKRQRRPFI